MSGTSTPPTDGGRRTPGIVRDDANARARNGDIAVILPHERVFRIQIGSELFTLSGASLSSDAPSYFSQYFLCQLEQARLTAQSGSPPHQIKTLYIDRDPITFRDICRHLQGYHVAPRDGAHFVKLFADAQFYALPRLIDQLYEDNIYISIGHREFHVQKSLFTAPGDTPNYFTLGFGFMFAAPPGPGGSAAELFPGLDREGLLRPPSIVPPSVQGKSADIFAELVEMLKGYDVHIRNEEHRSALLRDARYFMFKGLEQRLVPHRIERNLVTRMEEIEIRLEDIRQSGINVLFQGVKQEDIGALDRDMGQIGNVFYARPFVDKKLLAVVLEIGDECVKINLSHMQAYFSGDAKKRMTKLIELIGEKAYDGTPSRNVSVLAEGVAVDLKDAAVCKDGKDWDGVIPADDIGGIDPLGPLAKKRKYAQYEAEFGNNEVWNVRRGQWKLQVRPDKRLNGNISYTTFLVAVKLEVYTGEKERSKMRAWLS